MENERERAEWIDRAAHEIVDRFSHTFPEVKADLEDFSLWVPIARIIANHSPQNPAEAARREERKRCAEIVKRYETQIGSLVMRAMLAALDEEGRP